MHITVIVEGIEREVTSEYPRRWWERPPATERVVPFAPQERSLLEELTRLCREVLIEDTPEQRIG